MGSWFAVPLKDGGFATGLVARMAPKGRIIVAYLFGPERAAVPPVGEMAILQPKDALRCLRIGDLGLVNGEWPILGELPDWKPEQWATPAFFGQDDLSGKVWRAVYPDSDPSQLPRREFVGAKDIVGLERDALYGSGVVETLMTKALRVR